MIKTFILCLFVVLMVIHPSQGSFCTKTGMYYAVQNYCTSYSWFGWWCWKTAYRRITVRDHYKTCCPGYKGKDCTKPICLEPCTPGYICSSPDMCTLDPSAICLEPCKPGYICSSDSICVLNPLAADFNGTITNSSSTNSTDVGVIPLNLNSTDTNSTSTNSTDVGEMPYNLNSTNTNISVTKTPYSTESPSVNTNSSDVTKAPYSTESPNVDVGVINY